MGILAMLSAFNRLKNFEPECMGETEFDLVLLDIQMPVMDGETAFKQMKREKLVRRSTVVALTGEDLDKVQETYLFMGMQGCLQKPLDKHDLEEACLK